MYECTSLQLKVHPQITTNILADGASRIKSRAKVFGISPLEYFDVAIFKMSGGLTLHITGVLFTHIKGHAFKRPFKLKLLCASSLGNLSEAPLKVT